MTRPEKILWYEPLSSFLAIIYNRFCRKKPKLYVHYHENMSPEEIKNGMILIRWFHYLEKQIYPHVEWLSHTNEFRMKLFLEDHQTVKQGKTRIMPNYPPRYWYDFAIHKERASYPVKLVYRIICII